MNQNVFGMILFSFIVVTAVFVSEFFVKLPTPPAVFERQVTVSHKYSCGKRIVQANPAAPIPTSLANVKVVQAVLNQQTNQLATDFSIKKIDPQTEPVGIALHFFGKNGRVTQYLATESITVKPDFDHKGRATHDIISSFKWLDDLPQRDNLYVIAEPTLNFRNSKSLEPAFDGTKAIPVLLMKERE